MRLFALALLTFLAACQDDETLSGYVDRATLWQLRELDGAPFEGRATIEFPRKGKVAGQAPCISNSARQTAPYPYFTMSDIFTMSEITATRSACSAPAQEADYLAALGEMIVAEINGPPLVLSNTEGREMVFEAVQP